MGVGLLPGNSNRMRGDGLKSRQGRFRLDVRNHFFFKRVVLQLHSCPGSGGVTVPGGVPELWDVALRDVGSGHGGVGWELHLEISVLFSNLNGSTIL